jgi:hypothetical protein
MRIKFNTSRSMRTSFKFNESVGFGVMQLDTRSDSNCMTLDHRESSPFWKKRNKKR